MLPRRGPKTWISRQSLWKTAPLHVELDRASRLRSDFIALERFRLERIGRRNIAGNRIEHDGVGPPARPVAKRA